MLDWKRLPGVLPGMKTYGARSKDRTYVVSEDHGAKGGVRVCASYKDAVGTTTGIGYRFATLDDAKAACEKMEARAFLASQKE